MKKNKYVEKYSSNGIIRLYLRCMISGSGMV